MVITITTLSTPPQTMCSYTIRLNMQTVNNPYICTSINIIHTPHASTSRTPLACSISPVCDTLAFTWHCKTPDRDRSWSPWRRAPAQPNAGRSRRRRRRRHTNRYNDLENVREKICAQPRRSHISYGRRRTIYSIMRHTYHICVEGDDANV